MFGVQAFVRRVRDRKLKKPLPAFVWPGEATEREKHLIAKYAPYTMTGAMSQWSLLKAIEYIDRQGISGAIVECGVWRGGNMMMAKEARHGALPERDIYLFDTFTGMSRPTAVDVDWRGLPALDSAEKRQRDGYNSWCYASLEEVIGAFDRFGLSGTNVHFRKGKVEETLMDAGALPERIALLRLDTDWYESTRVELETLYPRLEPRGVLIIDDYGYWRGARMAVDEYFGEHAPLLAPVDLSCRIAVKPHS
jgi:hypothetical protein